MFPRISENNFQLSEFQLFHCPPYKTRKVKTGNAGRH